MRTLAEWLGYIERQHPKAIALGLERVGQVFSRMKIKLACPILSVGGTNGITTSNDTGPRFTS